METTPIDAAASGAATDSQSVKSAGDANAYVGPQPFPPDRVLYGRDRELLALTNRLLSERLVLFYAPSGAGKTSLIQAKGGLRDRMIAEGFQALPVIRVGHAANVASREGVNRYLLSTLISLELARPESERRSAEALAQLIRSTVHGSQPTSLREHVAHLVPSATKAERIQAFLVFDQFEELLTLDPTDEACKHEFLVQVGTMLRDRDRWALFAMREDYVAALDPFLPLLPTRLAVTFRLDLLRREAAQEAICRPAKDCGVTFETEAAKNLVRELARMMVMDPVTARCEPRDGPYVEPLHLQLVCQRLWKERAAPDKITADDLDRLAHDAAEDVRGVGAALAHYYDDSIQAVAAQFGAQGGTERAIRVWFGQALISPTGLRLPFLFGNEDAYGLSGSVLRALADRYLIRSEQRHGGIYYELAHDRLVEPVQKSNAAFKKRLKPFQQAAELWKASGKQNDLLVLDEVLDEGARLRELNELSKDDTLFLEECCRARDARNDRIARKEARQFRQRITIGLVAVSILIAAVGWGVYTKNEFEKAKTKAKLSTDEALQVSLANVNDAYKKYLDAWQVVTDNPYLGLEKARESLRLFVENSPNDSPLLMTQKLLPKALANQSMQTFGASMAPASFSFDSEAINRHKTAVIELAFAGSNGKRLLTRDIDGAVLCWDDWTGDQLPLQPGRRLSSVTQMVLTPDGKYLIAGHSYGRVCRWWMDDFKTAPGFDSPEPIQDCPVTAVCVGAKEQPPYAVVGYGDGTVQVFKWGPDKLVIDKKAWPASKRSIANIVFATNALDVLTNTRDSEVRGWDLGSAGEKGAPKELKPQTLPLPVVQIFVSEDGKTMAAISERGQVVVSRTTTVLEPTHPFTVAKPEADSPKSLPRLTDLAFGPTQAKSAKEGSFLLFAATDTGASSLSRFDITEDGKLNGPLVVTGPKYDKGLRVTTTVFGSEGKHLVAGMSDGSTHVWSLDQIEKPATIMKASDSPVTAVLVGGPGEKWVITGQADGTVRRWEPEKQQDQKEIAEKLAKVQNDLDAVQTIVESSVLK